MSEPLQRLVAYVEGKLRPREFEQLLYHDAALQQLLQSDRAPSTDSTADDSYTALLQQDFADPGALVAVQELLTGVLQRRGVKCRPTDAYREHFDLLLRAQPEWLDLDLSWLEETVLSEAGGKKGAELEAWLRTRLLELFRCVGEPPEWIQNAEWPINENGPLVFLGQLSVYDYFHDEAAVYVFHDPVTGACETVIQVY